MAGLGDKINTIKKDFLDNPALQQLDKKKIIGILFVVLVLVYIDLAFLMSVQLKAIKKTGTDFKKLSTDIAKFKGEFDHSRQARQTRSPMVKEIIGQAEIPLLLQDISDIANKNNIRILQLIPAKEIKAKRGAVATELRANLIALDLICDYHDLGAFINGLENAAKFMVVEELEISPESDSVFQQSVNLVIKTYVK